MGATLAVTRGWPPGPSLQVPPGTFVNAGAGVKTNLLFFTRAGPMERIWYYDLSEVQVGKKTPLTLGHFEEFFRLRLQRADMSEAGPSPSRHRSQELRPEGREPSRQEQRRHAGTGRIARPDRSESP